MTKFKIGDTVLITHRVDRFHGRIWVSAMDTVIGRKVVVEGVYIDYFKASVAGREYMFPYSCAKLITRKKEPLKTGDIVSIKNKDTFYEIESILDNKARLINIHTKEANEVSIKLLKLFYSKD